MLPLFCDLKLHLQAFVLRSQTRQFHLFRRDWLRSSSTQLARRLGLHPVAKCLFRHAQFPGHHTEALPLLDPLDSGHLELHRVRLFRYFKHP